MTRGPGPLVVLANQVRAADCGGGSCGNLFRINYRPDEGGRVSGGGGGGGGGGGMRVPR